VNFIGQQSDDKFSHEPYFASRDADSLTAGRPLAVCLFGGSQHFENLQKLPMAVALLRTQDRGAVCAIAPSGLMYESMNLLFQIRLAQYLVSHPTESIGSAWYNALQSPAGETDLRRTLLGDPALIVKVGVIASTGEPVINVPVGLELHQNYPNPFNPSTTIRYGLPERSHVTLSVFNTLGQVVAVLEDGERGPGYHEVKFDGTGLSSGVYIYRMSTGTNVQAKKLLLLR
jgi:hypothetical protein